MKWEQYLIENEKVDGNIVYITDIRLSDGNAYIRNVPPTKVIITSNSELPKNKNVYYSDYHFRKLGMKGQILKQVIAPFDNTGYRHYTGVSVNIFNTYEEAVEKYNEQLESVVNHYEHKKNELDTLILNTLSLKIT